MNFPVVPRRVSHLLGGLKEARHGIGKYCQLFHLVDTFGARYLYRIVGLYRVMMSCIFIKLFLVISVLIPVSSYGAMAERINLVQDSYIYEDKDNTLTIYDLLDMDREGLMESFQKERRFSYGYTPSTIWVRSKLTNSSSHTIERYLGSIRPELAVVNLYQVQGSQVVKRWFGGANTPSNERN